MVQQDPIPLSSVFESLSQQLESLTRRVSLLEQASRNTLAQAKDVPDTVITDLQSFDYLRQSLCDLTKLTALLVDEAEGGVLEGSSLQRLNAEMLMSDSKLIFDPEQRHARPADVDQPGDTLIF